LSNEIVDMKRNNREGTSNQRPYMSFFKRPFPPKTIKPSPINLNIELEDVAMDNYCNFHQDNHSERT
jgi:hypothetical protein